MSKVISYCFSKTSVYLSLGDELVLQIITDLWIAQRQTIYTLFIYGKKVWIPDQGINLDNTNISDIVCLNKHEFTAYTLKLCNHWCLCKCWGNFSYKLIHLGN